MSMQKEITSPLGPKSEQKDGEDRAVYLQRLVKLADTLTDEQFKALSKGAKVWINEGTSAVDAGKPVKDFSDAAPATKPDKESKAEKEPTAKPAKADKAAPDKEPKAAKEPTAKPAKKEAPAKESKPAAEKKPKKAKSERAPGKGRGDGQAFRELIIKHWKATREELVEKANANGNPITLSTAYVIFYECRNAVRALAKAGLLTEEATAKYAASDAVDAPKEKKAKKTKE